MFYCDTSSYSTVYFRYGLNDALRTRRRILNLAQYDVELVMTVFYFYEGFRPSSSIPAQQESCNQEYIYNCTA